MPSDQLTIAYAAGPGDIVSTFRHWHAGEDDPAQIAMTYSGQFFQAVHELGARGVAISSNPRPDREDATGFTVMNLPKPALRSGLRYHLDAIRYGLQVARLAEQAGADMLVISESTTHWFGLNLFYRGSMALVPTVHCTLWPKLLSPGRLRRFLNRLDGPFFRSKALAMMTVSDDVAQQIRSIAGPACRPVEQFRPTYRPGTFDHVPAPPEGGPFHILFLGRIEENKGVFDLLAMAEQLRTRGLSDIVFDLCGEGSAMNRLRRKTEELGLTDTFRLHGHLHRPDLLARIAQSRAFIVPTTDQFIEGFNKVVVEAILSGRPVLTSSACPALEQVREAAVEVPAGNVNAYVGAIADLRRNRELYRAKQQACTDLQPPFYDPSRSWGAALKRVVTRYETMRGIHG